MKSRSTLISINEFNRFCPIVDLRLFLRNLSLENLRLHLVEPMGSVTSILCTVYSSGNALCRLNVDRTFNSAMKFSRLISSLGPGEVSLKGRSSFGFLSFE